MKKITSIALLFMLATISMTAQNVIDIVYNGNQATVNPNGITDVTSTVSGANVTIKSKTTSEEYTYRVSGTSTDGSLYIEGEYKLTLQLAGVKLTNASNANGGYAIDVECGKRIAVE
ncbi:MAG: carbohydrate-binding domain-containing protein, partial [Prevotella sp.]|nr:carbohydrate-binding domain-containing protein [Prevotella sp.]